MSIAEKRETAVVRFANVICFFPLDKREDEEDRPYRREPIVCIIVLPLYSCG